MNHYFKLGIFVTVLTYVYGQAMFQAGPCPSGYEVGDRWYPGCSMCYCNKDGHGCSGCGLLAPAPPGCSIVQNISATYPSCCPRIDCPVVG